MTLKKVCSTTDIPKNSVKAFKVDNLDIAIVNSEGKFYAIDRACTHMKGNLAKGTIEGKTIKCPLHGTVFNLETGDVLKEPGTIAGKLKKATKTNTYIVKTKDNFLYIEAP